MEAGDFSRLDGEGLPLPRENDAFMGDRWAATRVLRNANALPEWLELRREIEERRGRIATRVDAHRSWLRARRVALGTLPAERILDAVRATESADARFRVELAVRVAEVNERIARHNTVAPRPELQLAPMPPPQV